MSVDVHDVVVFIYRSYQASNGKYFFLKKLFKNKVYWLVSLFINQYTFIKIDLSGFLKLRVLDQIFLPLIFVQNISKFILTFFYSLIWKVLYVRVFIPTSTEGSWELKEDTLRSFKIILNKWWELSYFLPLIYILVMQLVFLLFYISLPLYAVTDPKQQTNHGLTNTSTTVN